MCFGYSLPTLLALSCALHGLVAQDKPVRRDTVHSTSTATPQASPTGPFFPQGGGGHAVVAASVGVLSVLCVCVLVTVVAVLAVRVWRRVKERRRTNVYDEVSSVNGSISRSSTMQLLSTHHSPARYPTERTPVPHLSPPLPPPPSPPPAPTPLVITTTHLPPQTPPPGLPPESPSSSHDYSEVFPTPFSGSSHPPLPPSPSFTPRSPIYDEVIVDPYTLGACSSHEDHLYCSVTDLPEVAEESCAESTPCQCHESAECDGHAAPGAGLGSKQIESIDCLEKKDAGQRWNSGGRHIPPPKKTPDISEKSVGGSGYTLPTISSTSASHPPGSCAGCELTDSERPQRVDPYSVSVIAPSWSTPKKETFSKCPSLEEEPGDASCGQDEPAGYNHLEEVGPKERDSRQYATLEPELSPAPKCSH